MKKAGRLLSILLAVVMVFTSVGMVFADDAPPPLDDQSLNGPELNYPENDPNGFKPIFFGLGIPFNWKDVPGADSYVLEIQTNKNGEDWVKAFAPVKINSTVANPIPATTYTINTKKPLSGIYRWRVTAFNTDVGIDPAGTGQSSEWAVFNVLPSWTVIDMFPGPVTAAGGVVPYSGVIDYKKGDGTVAEAPTLNWVVENAGSGFFGPPGGASPFKDDSRVYFKMILTQGAHKYSKLVQARDGGITPACVDYAYSTFENLNALCTTTFSGFTPLKSTSPALTKLEPGKPYTWQVIGVYQRDAELFPNPAPIMAEGKDTLEYNKESDKFGPVLEAVVTDTLYTNKPTFMWKNTGVPGKGGYQLVVESYDTTKAKITWKTVTTNIVPGTTKIPGTKTLACPSATGGYCFYYFAAPYNPKFRYRWNVRVLAGGKYGPWANPGTNALLNDDMVQINKSGDLEKDIWYDGTDGAYNYFGVSRPFTPQEVSSPVYNSISADPKLTIYWNATGINDFYGILYYPTHYKIDLTRLAPAPLTTTPKVLSIEKPASYFNPEATTHCEGDGNCEISGNEFITYTTNGLPRGIYQVVITPKSRLGDGQYYVSKVKNPVSRFIIGPAAPNLDDLTNFPTAHEQVGYVASTKTMSVRFVAPAVPANMKYRVLVAMKTGALYRWVKISSFAGTACKINAGVCTLEFPVYKPGSKTKEALAAGTYRVSVQAAQLEEGNLNAALNKKFGPFGPLSDPAWEWTLSTAP